MTGKKHTARVTILNEEYAIRTDTAPVNDATSADHSAANVQGASQILAAANAEHIPAVLDLHLDAQTAGHAAFFATMAAMPIVDEHLVTAAA